MTIALFGGSFDPPHIGHEKIVNKVLLELNDIEKLIIMPTFLNPFKTKFDFKPQERYNLMTELFQQNKFIDVLNFEIKQNKPVATIDTINYLKKIYKAKKIYLIIGSDNLKSLDKWKDFQILKRSVEFIVITRKQYEVKNDIIEFKIINMDIDISSSNLRETHNINYIPIKIQQKVKQIWNKE